MTFNLLMLAEFPDTEADRAGGRRHLVILLGRPAAAKLYVAMGLAVPVSLTVSVGMGLLPPLCLLACLPSLLLIPAVRWALLEPESLVPFRALANNVAWNLSTHAVLAGSLIVACWCA